MNSNDFDDEKYLTEEQDNKDGRIKTIKYIGFGLLFILIIIVLLFLLKGCNLNNGKTNDDDLAKTLLNAGKLYYENNEYLLPSSSGECSTVDLKVLKDYGLVKKAKFEECNEDNTYVKVCKLESSKLHWVPILSCDSYKSEDHYLSWKEGKESNLIDGKSDVRFLFLGKILDLKDASLGPVQELWKNEITVKNYKTLAVINYYSYRDKEYIWNINDKYYYTSTGDKTNVNDVSEYYTTSPKSGYTKKDSEDSTVAKWYISEGGTRVYWEGADGNPYSATQPSGYNYYTDGIIINKYTTRTFTRVTDSVTKSASHRYICSNGIDPNTINSSVPCSENPNPGYTITVREFYSCDDGLTETTAGATCYSCTNGNHSLSPDNLSCGTYSNWVPTANNGTTPCTGSTLVCLKLDITVYKWYKMENEVKSYYPSGSATASGEKIYYKTAPVSGAVKDLTTTTTGYKWYKTVTSQTSGYSVNAPKEGATKTDTFRWTNWTDYSSVKPSSNSGREITSKQKIRFQEILSTATAESWTNITDDYMTEQDMISKFKELGKDVNHLSDITGDMKYVIKLYFRSLNEED